MRMITVCSECKMASCWYWEFPCDKAQSAGLVQLSVSELRKLNREHPSYWTKKSIEKYTGVKQ